VTQAYTKVTNHGGRGGRPVTPRLRIILLRDQVAQQKSSVSSARS